MQLTHFYHRHHLHRFIKLADLHFFELTIWLHTVARSFIAVFIPILLLKSGYSVTHIFTFYLLYHLIDVPLNFAVQKLLRRFGARKIMVLGTLATITFFCTLAMVPPNNWPMLLLLAVLAAIYDTLFWIAHIYLFTESNRGSLDTGKSSGALEAVRKLAHIIGPFIGALILINLGKTALVIVSIITFIISIIPLYKMRHIRDIPNENPLSFRRFFSQPQAVKDHFALALMGVSNQVNDIVLPLFIFILLGSIQAVAAIPLIMSLSTALFSYFAGKLTKQHGTQMITLGSLLLAFIWIIRLTLPYPGIYYASIFLFGFFTLLVAIPLDANVTNRGLKVGPLIAATYRNAASMIMGIPLYLALILLVNRFQFSFEIAAVSMFFLAALYRPHKSLPGKP